MHLWKSGNQYNRNGIGAIFIAIARMMTGFVINFWTFGAAKVMLL
jgi:hypothetical protein